MSFLALARPHWDRSLRQPAGVLAVLVLPLALAGVALVGPAQPDRWQSLMVLGWGMVGVLPATLAAFANDEALEARYRALPIGPADRLLGAFAGQFPVALCASGLLALVALGLGPAALRQPVLLSVAALAAGTFVLVGLAIAAWCRSPWARAGALGLATVALAAGLVKGPSLAWAAWLPSGLAKASLVALAAGSPGQAAVPLAILAMTGLVAAIVGLLGLSRR